MTSGAFTPESVVFINGELLPGCKEVSVKRISPDSHRYLAILHRRCEFKFTVSTIDTDKPVVLGNLTKSFRQRWGWLNVLHIEIRNSDGTKHDCGLRVRDLDFYYRAATASYRRGPELDCMITGELCDHLPLLPSDPMMKKAYAAPGDYEFQLQYADWLEEHGHTFRPQYIRRVVAAEKVCDAWLENRQPRIYRDVFPASSESSESRYSWSCAEGVNDDLLPEFIPEVLFVGLRRDFW